MMMTSTENKPLMRVFIDTNVIVDALTDRDYKSNTSVKLLQLIIEGQVKGYICNKQITDLYYILKKYISNETARRNLITTILKTFELLPLLKGDILACIHTSINDFEDAVLEEVAKVNVIPYFVTNNTKDFKNSRVTILSPEQILTLLQL